MRNPHFSGEQDKIVWFCGSSEVTVAHLAGLTMTEYKNFLPTIGANMDSVPLRAVLKDIGNKITVSFMIDNTFGLAYMHSGVKEAHTYLLTEIAPGCRSSLT